MSLEYMDVIAILVTVADENVAHANQHRLDETFEKTVRRHLDTGIWFPTIKGYKNYTAYFLKFLYHTLQLSQVFEIETKTQLYFSS
jgi:hypothetical protein